MTNEEKTEIVNELIKRLEISIETRRFQDYYSTGTKIKVRLLLRGENDTTKVISESEDEISDSRRDE